jgi:ubiquinone/menaquinone biosynthesis C-methylase UbiE
VPPELTDLVEGPHALPPGQALDLGCGTGTQAIYLAQHGWQVTGVDVVARPLDVAKRKATAVGVPLNWIQGDITHLSELGVGTDHNLILDLACFHGLKAEERPGTARQITRVAAPGAIFLLGAFASANRGPLPRGIDEDEVVGLFGGDWHLLWQRRAPDTPLPKFLKSANPTWYCLRRR